MEEQKDLVPQQPAQAPMLLSPDDYGLGDEITSEGVQLPIIKICQKSTRNKPDGVQDGDFYNASTGKNYGKRLTMHVMRSYRGRIKFTSDYKLECKSNDCITGSVYGKCNGCLFSKWVDDRELRKKNYCNHQMTFLVVVEGELIPSVISLSKVRESAGNKLNSHLKFLQINSQTLPAEQRVPIYFYKTTLESFQEDYNGERTFNVRHTPAGVEKNQEKQGVLVGLYRQWKEYSSANISSPETEHEEEGPKESKAF